MCIRDRAPAKSPCFDRRPKPSPEFREGQRIKLKSLGRDGVSVNRETIDLRYLEQLADGEQSAALGYCVVYAQKYLLDGKRTLRQVVEALDRIMEEKTLSALCDSRSNVPCLARPRKLSLIHI